MLNAGSIALKGKSDRLGLRIVVGDETMRESETFQALAARHMELVESIEKNMSPDRSVLDDCIRRAETISADLVAFYRRIPERLEDFVEAGKDLSPVDGEHEDSHVTTILAERA